MGIIDDKAGFERDLPARSWAIRLVTCELALAGASITCCSASIMSMRLIKGMPPPDELRRLNEHNNLCIGASYLFAIAACFSLYRRRRDRDDGGPAMRVVIAASQVLVGVTLELLVVIVSGLIKYHLSKPISR
jgi:hypothetical protein